MRLAVLALLLAGGLAHANGRAPQTIGIYFKGDDTQTIYLSTTFGLLISNDEGCTFNWICEQNIGYGGTWDPAYEIGTDGTIFATTFEGLRISRDNGCSFETVMPGIWIDALDIGPTGEIWIGTAETGGTNDVFVSQDNGTSFSSRGMLSPEIWWKSVKVAPSNPATVYITGYQVAGTPTAYFYRTTNGGMDWTPSPLADVMYASTPVLRVKAIDPTNPDIVYTSSEGGNPPAGDRLYRSTDGGITHTEVLATPATVQDVLIKDAQNIYVTTAMKTATSVTAGATYHSTDGGTSFAELADAPKLVCIAARSDGVLFGCGANWDPDFKAVARSADGVSWEKVWRFVEIAGAVKCAPGTVQHDTCDVALWDCPSCMTDLKRQFGAKGPACGVNATDPPIDTMPPKKGCCDAGPGGAVNLVWFVLGALWLTRRRR